MAKVQVSIYHDTRNPKASGVSPVKLRVYYREKVRLYPTGIEQTTGNFERSYGTQKPQKEFKDIKFKLIELERKAKEVVDSMPSFTFEGFEKKMFRPTGDNDNVIHYYNEYIKQLRHQNKINTALNYELSLKSILKFVRGDKTSELKHLSFETITPKFLNDYEQWMIGNGKQATTVGIYTRPLRAIFNIGKGEGVVTEESYPFGKKKYQIPAGQNIKKALSKEDLKKFYTQKVKPGSEQEKARDYWFLSYQCNGMNFRDIAELRVGDIQGSVIVFTRAKSRNTTKANSKKIVVPITEKIQSLITKYRTGTTKGEYLFPIFNSKLTADEKHRVIQNFIRFVNQHIKIIAKEAKIDENLSTYWARHSFTTIAIRNGASMEYIQESLGHQSIGTTMAYWSGFEEKAKLEVAQKLMDF